MRLSVAVSGECPDKHAHNPDTVSTIRTRPASRAWRNQETRAADHSPARPPGREPPPRAGAPARTKLRVRTRACAQICFRGGPRSGARVPQSGGNPP
jgi:hypothetical protein